MERIILLLLFSAVCLATESLEVSPSTVEPSTGRLHKSTFEHSTSLTTTKEIPATQGVTAESSSTILASTVADNVHISTTTTLPSTSLTQSTATEVPSTTETSTAASTVEVTSTT